MRGRVVCCGFGLVLVGGVGGGVGLVGIVMFVWRVRCEVYGLVWEGMTTDDLRLWADGEWRGIMKHRR